MEIISNINIDGIFLSSSNQKLILSFLNLCQFLAALAALYLTLVTEWVSNRHFRIWHKEWLLRLQVLRTYDQSDFWQKYKKKKRQKDKETTRKKDEKDKKMKKTKRQKNNKQKQKNKKRQKKKNIKK